MGQSGLGNNDVANLANAIAGEVIVNASQISLLKNAKLQDPGCRIFLAILMVHRVCYSTPEIPAEYTSLASRVTPIPGCDENTSLEDLVRWFFGWDELPGQAKTSIKPLELPAWSEEHERAINEAIRKALVLMAVQHRGAVNPQECLIEAYPLRDTRRRGRFFRWLKGSDWTPEELEEESFCLARIAFQLAGDESPLADPIEWVSQLALSSLAEPGDSE